MSGPWRKGGKNETPAAAQGAAAGAGILGSGRRLSASPHLSQCLADALLGLAGQTFALALLALQPLHCRQKP
jgi:hypothetical protein